MVMEFFDQLLILSFCYTYTIFGIVIFIKLIPVSSFKFAEKLKVKLKLKK